MFLDCVSLTITKFYMYLVLVSDRVAYHYDISCLPSNSFLKGGFYWTEGFGEYSIFPIQNGEYKVPLPRL